MSVLPKVSVLTPTANRANFLSFGIHNLRITTYPHELIEWVILDDGDERYIPEDVLDKVREILSPIRIKYVYEKKKTDIGVKRNNIVRLASHDFLVNMDDDDIYTPEHILTGINLLLSNKRKIGLVGHSANILIYPHQEYKITYNNCKDVSLLTENTHIFTRKHWKIAGGYSKLRSAEGLGMTQYMKNNCMLYGFDNWSVLQVAHKSNTVNKDEFLKRMEISDSIELSDLTINLIRFVIKVDPPSDLKIILTETNKVITFGELEKEIHSGDIAKL